MNLGTVPAAVVAGVVSGSLQFLPTLGVALLYHHGRYLPLWLPSLGLVGAYALHATWSNETPSAMVLVAPLICIGLAWLFQRLLFRSLVESNRALQAMIVGIGLDQIFEACTSLYGDGMSQHYPTNALRSVVLFRLADLPVFGIDILSTSLSIAAAVSLWAFLSKTRTGLRVRAVLANRDYARTLGLPVERVDAIVLAIAAPLAFTGATLRGIRFDLQPAMMFYPGLSMIAAVVTAGPGRYWQALAVVVGIDITVALVGTVPAISPLQRATPFVILTLVLIWRTFQSRMRAK